MAPIRLRHPKGVTTVDVDIASDTLTVRDLQQLVFSHTEIAPSAQELKAGYPPHALTLIPELPISSLGLQRGEQLVVTEARASSTTQHRATGSASSAGAIQPASVPVPLTADEVETVRVDGGVLVHRVVPDDNACLFSSIAVLFAPDTPAQKLREVVADEIRKNELTYDDAVLGQPRESYIAAISKPATWGGAIELAIFADHFQTEIASIDVESGRADRFGEGKYAQRAVVLYSGIHYDAVSLAPTPSAPPEFHETVFPVKNDGVLRGALELATKLRTKKKFTNTATFDLKCEICGKGLKGEKEARLHAKDTGHSQFGEY